MGERVALVVGAAGGPLVRATALSLAGTGFTVLGVDRSEQGLAELTEGIHRERGDSADPAAARRLVDRIALEVGSPEVLVNTIGAFRVGAALTRRPRTGVIAFLVIDAAAPVSGALLPAYGA